MKTILFILFLSCSLLVHAQTTITGTVKNSQTEEPIIGASISVKGKMIGTITDTKGNFSLSLNLSPPFTLIITVVGYQRQEVEVTDATQPISIGLVTKTEIMDEVVFTASRVDESLLKSPVSVEKMNTKAIRETPSMNFYEGLQNLKGVEMITSGLTYKQINTRGFNDTGNARFLQLVDGVDNQTPGLTFAVGYLFGSSDLDMESAELIPGSASALYGPVAFNGVLMLRTKNPFQYQGLSAQVKTGVNHINEKYVTPHPLYDMAIRYAKAFNNRFAFKFNASYFSGLDWYATNYTDVNYNTPANQRGDNNPGRDALNIYGDESARSIPGVGSVSRTGYEERDLMNYNTYSLKLNGALHYRITNNMELIYQYNYNQGRAAYTGSSRFQLNDFNFQQHRVEMRGGNYFIRAYASLEDSKNSYSSRSLGQLINKTWVRNLDGTLVSDPNQADNVWFDRYTQAFEGNIGGVTAGDNSAARTFADQGRYLPGSTEFNAQKDRLIKLQGLGGAGILSQSKLYHAEGQYDFSSKIKVFDLLVGGNFRMYDMFTNGTLFDDKNNPIKIKEGGAFIQSSKKLLGEKLKLTGSLRYDKNQNFDGHLTPRASLVYTVAKNHNFRGSFQTGFRNPTPGDQYIKLNVGPITILGGVHDNSRGMNVYENTFTTSSLGPFFGTYYGALGGGSTPGQAIAAAKDMLVKSNVPYVKPEQVRTFEIGYKGLLGENLLVDANYYFSSYTNFLLNQVVIQPQHPVLASDGTVNVAAAQDLVDGNSHLFQLYTNSSERVTAQGATLGLTQLLPRNYTISANGTWASFNLRNAKQNEIPPFNTPRYRTTVTFGNSSVVKNIGFNVAWRWQDTFQWYGTFNGLNPGTIPAYSIVDAQVSYKLANIKSIIKLGGNNILNKKVSQAYGSPAIGAVYYVSIIFDQFLNR